MFSYKIFSDVKFLKISKDCFSRKFKTLYKIIITKTKTKWKRKFIFFTIRRSGSRKENLIIWDPFRYENSRSIDRN